MPETKRIASLYVVTDTETSQEKIGDIDGGLFDHDWLRQHVASHGSAGLIEALAYMNHQIVQAQRDYNKSQHEDAKETAVAV
jgi:hypothetical protein